MMKKCDGRSLLAMTKDRPWNWSRTTKGDDKTHIHNDCKIWREEEDPIEFRSGRCDEEG